MILLELYIYNDLDELNQIQGRAKLQHFLFQASNTSDSTCEITAIQIVGVPVIFFYFITTVSSVITLISLYVLFFIKIILVIFNINFNLSLYYSITLKIHVQGDGNNETII